MTELTYRDRVKILRDKKIEHTLGKIKQQGYMDSDDYGTVPKPEGYRFVPTATDEDGGFYGAAGWALNFEKLMDIHPIYVDPMEILCGRWRDMLISYYKGWPKQKCPYTELEENQKLYNITSGIGASSHFVCDYGIGLSLGWNGLLQKIRDCRDAHGPDKREFYDAEEKVVLAIQKWIGKHIDEIKRLLAAEERPEIRATLEDMLRCNEHIVGGPPRTFLEACQWISWFSVVSRIYDRDGAGLSLDVILYPYYKRDVDAGILDDEKAKFIMANLLLIETHYHQLSGPDTDGNDLTNPLSWLILEAAHWLNTSNNLTVRYHDNIDPAFFRKAVSYLFTDRNGWPRFSGDRGLMGYMKNEGITREIARSRFAVGCNWMAVPGMEYPLNDCIKINMARVFEVAFHEMMEEEDPSMDRLAALIEKHTRQAVSTTAAGINLHLDNHYRFMPELVMNLMMRDTLEKGEDISQCARLLTVGIDGIGLATAADSLAALEQRIEREGRTTFEAVHEALQNDFEGVEGERMRLMLSSSERYCQGNTLGDKWAVWLSDLFTRTVKAQPMPGRRQLVPGWFSWSRTIEYGRAVGATPGGRKSGTPVSHGANPTPGFRKDGAATAMATGIAGIQPGWGNTAPLQLEFDPHLSVEEGGIDRVVQLLKTHLDLGGTLININVLDKAKIEAANENPMLYPDLVVRVTGFTAYFVALSPQFRQLVMDRFVEGF